MVKKIKGNIPARAHPPHYMMHRYWGRKAHNVINKYIENYTSEGDTVLDPFMGSGIVIIESAKLKRKGIGFDLNPLSCFIAENTLTHIDIDKFEKYFLKIFENNQTKYQWLYESICPSCNSISKLVNSVWSEKGISKVKGHCDNCGTFTKSADEFDKKLIKKAEIYLPKSNIKYPKDKILDYVKRSKKTNINQLFTSRALIILGSIRNDISKIKDKKIRNIILLCFSSMVPNVSKMIPGDESKVNGKSGWVVSKLWAPKIHTEKNIFDSFFNRFKKIRKGKQETNQLINFNDYSLINKSSERIKKIKDNSVDYIFTDPPYGESIAYFGLSMFFNAWLELDVDYDNEIIYDPYRHKKHEDYNNRLQRVFKELFRVLKFNKYLSFTFHNRNLLIWKNVMDSVKSAGFELKNIAYQEQAVQSGTQGLNRKNTLKGDFVYNFKKQKNTIRKKNTKKSINSKKAIIKKISLLMLENNNFITPDKLFENLIPYIVNNDVYVDIDNKPIDVEKILNEKYTYAPSKNDHLNYGWHSNE